MSIVVEPMSRSDSESIMRGIWGSYEKMKASPLYKECVERQEYLSKLITRATLEVEKEIAGTRWWNIKGKIFAPLYRYSLRITMVQPAERLIARYESHKMMIIGFSVKLTNDEFDSYIEVNRNTIMQLNKLDGIFQDKYLK